MNLKVKFLIVVIVTATSCDTTKVRSSKSCYTNKNSSGVFRFIRQEGHQVVVQDLNTKSEIKLWNDEIVEIPCKRSE